MGDRKITISKPTVINTLFWLLGFIFFPAAQQGFVSTAEAQTLLILTADDFFEELLPLQEFKEINGRPTILLALGQIRSNFKGVDDPERVKRCIASYESNSRVKYVMLVGDIDRFPARYHWWGLPGQEHWAVNDLYYADLYKADGTFDKWDSNNNGIYGEVEFSPDGVLNNDHINFLPDVAVGRIPASNEAEVTRYVHKLIRYETFTRTADKWFQRAGFYTGDLFKVNEIAPLIDEVITMLVRKIPSFNYITRYWDGIPSNTRYHVRVPGADDIINDLNAGLGFVNYLGHGNSAGWAWEVVGQVLGHGDIMNRDGSNRLTNADKLPIVFANACDTGGFAYLAPFGPYLDVAGQAHCGTINGETFSGNPPAPAPIQENNSHGVSCNNRLILLDPECFAEHFLFDYGDPPGSGGAIAYVGARSGSRRWAEDLNRYFFHAYGMGGHEILGDMWRHMMEEYYNKHNLSAANQLLCPPENWEKGHEFVEPMKFILFGDPSLYVGGMTGSSWQAIGEAFGEIIVGLKGDQIEGTTGTAVYATKLPQGDIYQYKELWGPLLKWVKIGGPGKKFVTVKDQLYGLSPDGSGVYQYQDTPGQWKQVGGPASMIYGGYAGLFATNPQTGDLYAYNCSCGGSFRQGWTRIGGPGKMFAVGAQYVYGLSPDANGVFRYDFNAMSWTQIGGPASHIYAGGANFYAPNPQSGDIYEYNQSTGRWTKIGGPGKMFTVSQASGDLYGLSPAGNGIYRYMGTPNQWTRIGGDAAGIYAGLYRLYAVSAQRFNLWLWMQTNP